MLAWGSTAQGSCAEGANIASNIVERLAARAARPKAFVQHRRVFVANDINGAYAKKNRTDHVMSMGQRSITASKRWAGYERDICHAALWLLVKESMPVYVG